MKTNIDELAIIINKLSLNELDELSIILQIQFGMSATLYHLPVGITPITYKTDKTDKTDTFNVHITKIGKSRLSVVKLIKKTFNLGLRDSLDFVDKIPYLLAEHLTFDDAKKMKNDFEDVGATVKIIG